MGCSSGKITKENLTTSVDVKTKEMEQNFDKLHLKILTAKFLPCSVTLIDDQLPALQSKLLKLEKFRAKFAQLVARLYLNTKTTIYSESTVSASFTNLILKAKLVNRGNPHISITSLSIENPYLTYSVKNSDEELILMIEEIRNFIKTFYLLETELLPFLGTIDSIEQIDTLISQVNHEISTFEKKEKNRMGYNLTVNKNILTRMCNLAEDLKQVSTIIKTEIEEEVEKFNASKNSNFIDFTKGLKGHKMINELPREMFELELSENQKVIEMNWKEVTRQSEKQLFDLFKVE